MSLFGWLKPGQKYYLVKESFLVFEKGAILGQKYFLRLNLDPTIFPEIFEETTEHDHTFKCTSCGEWHECKGE